MFLTENSVINYLLYRGLLKVEEVFSEKTIVRKSFSRNRNFIVSLPEDKGYFVKQISTTIAEKQQTLRSEANCYWLANNDPEFAALQPVICKYYDYNPLHHVLVIESIDKGINIFDYLQQYKNVSEAIAISMANVLSVMHHITLATIEELPSNKLFSKFIPWIFKIEKNKKTFFNVTTPATKQLIDIVNEHSNFIELINECIKLWEVKTLIHGDVKFANFFITDKEAGSIKLIDLEICDIGDPCWDVAGVLQAYLTWWIDFANSDNVTLSTLQPSVKQFWSAYTVAMKAVYPNEQDLLKKCIQYTAIRMIQTSYEMATAQQQLQFNQIKTLQMSLNILIKPQQAAIDLFAIK